MNTEQIRKDFEEWMGDGGQSPRAIERNSKGDYILMQSASAWHVWKAAHTHYAKPAAPVVLPEPDSYLFQHEDTGQTMFVDAQQVEWGFEANNPRLHKVSGVYTEQQVRELLARDLGAAPHPKTDALDAECFRFWVSEAARSPAAMAKLIMHCTTEDEYRAAITQCIDARKAAIAAAKENK